MTHRPLLGIDLGGTNCRGALIDAQGQTFGLQRMPTPQDADSAKFVGFLTDLCQAIIQSTGISSNDLEGVGIGVPGVVAADGKVLFAPNVHVLNGLELGSALASRLKCPVRVVNDVNAVAWGEYRFGAGRPYHSLVTLTLGTGVGGGLVLSDRLWEGIDGSAGEIGHIMVEADGRPCACGSTGCLEQYASARGIVLSVKESLSRGQASSLAKFPQTELTSALVAKAALAGDEVALNAFAEAGRRLGQVLAGLANLLNLEAAILGGGASASFNLILPTLHQELARRAFDIPAKRMNILAGVLGDYAGILGAADLVHLTLNSP